MFELTRNEVIPYILEARDYFEKEYRTDWKRYGMKVKYFEALYMHYCGESVESLADKLKCHPVTARTQIKAARHKVELYLKLKEAGRL